MRAGTRAAGVLATAAVLGLVAAPTALAATSAETKGDVDVVNAETVQVYLSPEGKVESRRVYEQLTMTGNGTYSLQNPVETNGLRNLDGFGSVDVKDGKQVVTGAVDGTEQLRMVSDFDGELPVTVTPTYVLDGKKIRPGDLVGRSGRLEVTYEVANRTSVQQQVTVSDGAGNEVTRSVSVPVPLVGTLSTTLPSAFTRVEPNGASSAGDGKGGTRLSYTMTLFPPLGSDTATLTYAANVVDAVVPRVDVTMLPIDPFANPTVKKAADSYDSGAATGADLVAGAVEIDTNLLKLRDGAAELLAGLVKLSDGAAELTSGLTSKAAPGSRKLADGASELSVGLGQLDDGAGRLSAGAGDLSDGAWQLYGGTGDAVAGGEALHEGLGLISGGLSELAGKLPAAAEGITQLQAGVDQLVLGLGSPSNPESIIGGLAALKAGLTQLEGGSTQLKGGLAQLAGAGGLGAAKGGADQMQSELDGKLVPGGSVDQLIGGLNALVNVIPSCTADPLCQGTAQQLLAGAEASKADLQALSAGLGQLSGGIGSAITALNTQLIPGAAQIEGGLGQALVGTGKLQTGADQVLGGLQQVDTGLVQLAAGVTAAVQGVFHLDAGAGDAYARSGLLVDGLDQLDDGAGLVAGGAEQLADGSVELADGAKRARDGSGRLATGAGDLADGLGDAADGSGLLADGLQKAAGGAPQIVDGAGRLSKEGMGKLTQAGTETAVEYGTLSATIKAAAQRSKESGMALGAPEGAKGLTAYAFVMKGDDGESTRNWTRGLGAAVLLGLGGLAAVRRRLV